MVLKTEVPQLGWHVVPLHLSKGQTLQTFYLTLSPILPWRERLDGSTLDTTFVGTDLIPLATGLDSTCDWPWRIVAFHQHYQYASALEHLHR